MIRTILFLSLLLTILPASARMYQWSDSDSGRTHLSGNPPPWYRSGADGPRVFVFQQGQLVDDTGIEVSEQRRRSLREQALIEAAENQEAAREQAEKAAAIQGQFAPEGSGLPPELALPDTAEQMPARGDALQSGADDRKLSAEQEAELRTLVSEWEARNQAVNQQQLQDALEPDAASAEQQAAAGDAVTTPPNITREQLLEYLDNRVEQ